MGWYSCSVDSDKTFNAVWVLPDHNADGGWNTCLLNWFFPYTCYTLEIHSNRATQFCSKIFLSYKSTAGIKLHFPGVDSDLSLGIGGRYHHLLRRIFRKARDADSDTPLEDALRLATKAINDTAGPKGLFPSQFVFGVMPRILVGGFDWLPGIAQRLKEMQAARKKSQENSQSLFTTALKSKELAAVHHDMGIGSKVLFYKEPPLGKGTGPFRVLDMKEKAFYLRTRDVSSSCPYTRWNFTDGPARVNLWIPKSCWCLPERIILDVETYRRQKRQTIG